MDKIRVVIFEDLVEISEYFTNIINRQDNMEVVATPNNGINAINIVKEKRPDIILMDIQMETEHAGIDATEKITSNFLNMKVIMLTIHKNDNLILDAYIAGAVDYLDKMSNEDEIIGSINNVFTNDNFIGPVISRNLKNIARQNRVKEQSLLFLINQFSHLSTTEIDILKMLCQGYSRNEICNIKYIEISTIKSQIRSILSKLNFSSTKSLMSFLKNNGIFDYFK